LRQPAPGEHNSFSSPVQTAPGLRAVECPLEAGARMSTRSTSRHAGAVNPGAAIAKQCAEAAGEGD
jgi:hypothetical protein